MEVSYIVYKLVGKKQMFTILFFARIEITVVESKITTVTGFWEIMP